MSPERPERPEAAPTSSATPAEEAAVRRLLADARAAGPVPDDVAARLEATLADLHAEGAGPHGRAGAVSPLDAARRRRRRAGAMLLAAAVVVVGAVGIGQLVEPAEPDASGGASSAEAPQRGTGSLDQDSESGGDAAEPEGSAEQAEPPSAVDPEVAELASTPRLSQTRFAQDVETVRRTLEGVDTDDVRDLGRRSEMRLQRACAPADWGSGELVAVTYRGQPAVLAFREAAGNSQVVELLRCGTAEVVRSTTLPAG